MFPYDDVIMEGYRSIPKRDRLRPNGIATAKPITTKPYVYEKCYIVPEAGIKDMDD